MDDATQKVIDKVAKLLQLAARAGTEAEATSAAAKAQDLMTAYNLTLDTVEQAEGVSGKRLDEQVAGGMYKFQRRLWTALAELNFCMYFTQKVRVKEGTRKFKRGRKFTHQHRLVGRQVNVVTTKNMAGYLGEAIDRLCLERLHGRRGEFYSAWAVAFREGVADRVIDKIQDRREAFLKDEEKKARDATKKARAAGREGVSTASAITVAKLSEKEEAANYDFLHGEGAWARKQARDAEWEKEWAERRQRQARAEAAAEKEHARWAAAHPEEAAAEEKKARAKERSRERRAERRGQSWRYRSFRSTKSEMRRHSGGYYDGWDAGSNVSIDPQVGGGQKRIGRG